MLARLQQLIVLFVFGSSAGWAAYFISAGRLSWAVMGAALIVLGYAAFLGFEFVLLYFVQDQELVPRASAAELLRAWLGEVLMAPRVFFWRQPFRANVHPDSVHGPRVGRRGVVLVHGFVCNRGLWNPWMRELRARKTSFVAVNLEPVFGSIDEYVSIIERAVQRIEAATGMPAVLVGHSMGGLAIRAWLAQCNAHARVARVITVGSPHRGTWLARYGHTCNSKQMRAGGPWLSQLASREGTYQRSLFTCFFGRCDNIVFPVACATMEGARNLHLAGSAHVDMLFRPEVFSEVWKSLAPDPTAPETARH
jgi:triacylglycerol lipase